MIFTTKAEYGVRLLVELGRNPDGAPVSLKAIAEHENLPLAYLERIAALLKKAGLVQATRGAHGGYRLAKAPSDIRMDEVVTALDGPVAPMACFVDDFNEAGTTTAKVLCSHHDHGELCATKLLWMRVQGSVTDALQRTTLQELVNFSQRETKTPVLT